MTDLLPVAAVERVIVSADAWGFADRRAQNVKTRYPNGYGLSVTRGHGSYSGENTFEVAPIQWTGVGPDDWDFAAGLLGWNGDNIRGWQTEEDLLALERQVAALD